MYVVSGSFHCTKGEEVFVFFLYIKQDVNNWLPSSSTAVFISSDETTQAIDLLITLNKIRCVFDNCMMPYMYFGSV